MSGVGGDPGGDDSQPADHALGDPKRSDPGHGDSQPADHALGDPKRSDPGRGDSRPADHALGDPKQSDPGHGDPDSRAEAPGASDGGAFSLAAILEGALDAFLRGVRAFVPIQLALNAVLFSATWLALLLSSNLIGNVLDRIRSGETGMAAPVDLAAQGAVALTAYLVLPSAFQGAATVFFARAMDRESIAPVGSRLLRASIAGALCGAIAAGPVLAIAAAAAWVLQGLSAPSSSGLPARLLVGGVCCLGVTLLAFVLRAYLALAPAAIAFENAPISDALRRSAALVRGRFLQTSLLVVALWMIGGIGVAVASAFVGFPSFEEAGPAEVERLIPAIVSAEVKRIAIDQAFAIFTSAYAVLAWIRVYFSRR